MTSSICFYIQYNHYVISLLIYHIWWRRRGLNPRPPDCEPGALPAELRPHAILLLYLNHEIVQGFNHIYSLTTQNLL